MEEEGRTRIISTERRFIQERRCPRTVDKVALGIDVLKAAAKRAGAW